MANLEKIADDLSALTVREAAELAKMLEIAQPACLLLGERYLSLVPESSQSSVSIVLLDGEATGSHRSYDALMAESEPDQMHFPEVEAALQETVVRLTPHAVIAGYPPRFHPPTSCDVSPCWCRQKCRR